MTGIEELNAKLISLGCNKTQLNAKLIPMMLSIFASEDHPDAWQVLSEKIKKTEIAEYKATEALNEIEEMKRTIEQKQSIIAFHEKEVIAQKRELEKAKKQYTEQVSEMETAEMRDKIRALQIFNSSMPKNMNDFQMTEYVKGVAKILGN